MVAIAQLVERPPVARKVTGSYPVSYPIFIFVSIFLFYFVF